MTASAPVTNDTVAATVAHAPNAAPMTTDSENRSAPTPQADAIVPLIAEAWLIWLAIEVSSALWS